jgi:hypothetical protein
MASVNKQLGQATPTNSQPVRLYSPAAGKSAAALKLLIANTSAVDRTFRVFNHDKGSVRDKTTALHYDRRATARTTTTVSLGAIDNPAGEIAVSCDDATGSLTFTLFGVEIDID